MSGWSGFCFGPIFSTIFGFGASRAITRIKLYSAHKIAHSHVARHSVRYFSVTQRRNMKLVQFVYNDNPEQIQAGFMKGDNEVVDLHKADCRLPNTWIEILKNGYFETVQGLASKALPSVPLSSVTLKAPITGMDKVLCVGLNYKDHCKEQNLTPPQVPMTFSKFASCVVGPNEPVRLRTDVTNQVDWEVELCVVIAKAATRVKAACANNYILGATVAQDISARDWQKERNGGQFLLGKSMDTFCPIGPWIVTMDELGDIGCLDIECSVNGAQKQSSNTCQLIHKIPDVIERLSSVMTLLPGDIILTGTPGGVGQHRKPPEFLKPGDCMTSTIQNIGTLETRVEKY